MLGFILMQDTLTGRSFPIKKKKKGRNLKEGIEMKAQN